MLQELKQKTKFIEIFFFNFNQLGLRIEQKTGLTFVYFFLLRLLFILQSTDHFKNVVFPLHFYFVFENV